MKRLQKIFAMFLTFSLMMSLLSVSVFAEEPSRFACDCEAGQHIDAEGNRFNDHISDCWEKQLICDLKYDTVCQLKEHNHDEVACHEFHENHIEGCYELKCKMNADDDQPDCNKVEHICAEDGADCNKPLNCDLAHTHGDGKCQRPTICTPAEGEEHNHGDACYGDCTLEEHTHVDGCYAPCTLKHTHEDNCYHTHSDFEGACYERTCGLEVGDNLICGFAADYQHTHSELGGACFPAHVHDDDDCYKIVLTCEKSVYHVHSAACFKKTNSKTWPNATVCFDLVCDYADMEIYGHEYTCLTQADKTAIVESYPSEKMEFSVPEYSEPYIFSAMQTYLNPGYYYHNPNDGHYSNPKMMMMGNVQGMNPGDTWKWEGGKRFVSGTSNFVVAYCCDQDTDVQRWTMHRQVNLEDAGYYNDATAAKIRSVMMYGYPALTLEEIQENLSNVGFADYALLDEAAVIAGTQLAVWALSNTNTISNMHYWRTSSSNEPSKADI